MYLYRGTTSSLRKRGATYTSTVPSCSTITLPIRGDSCSGVLGAAEVGSSRRTPRELKASIGSPRARPGTLSLAKQVIFNVSMSRCHKHTWSSMIRPRLVVVVAVVVAAVLVAIVAGVGVDVVGLVLVLVLVLVLAGCVGVGVVAGCCCGCCG